jgi:hypothetical protein
MTVTIKVAGGKVAVASPYHPDFPSAARRLGGRWDAAAKTWAFDARDEARVRALCVDVYGTDGSPATTASLVTIRYEVSGAEGDAIFVAGRQVARRHSRDARAVLGEGVIVIKGGFPSSGGSARYPRLCGEGTVLEIRDVPEQHARDSGCEIVGAVSAEPRTAIVLSLTQAERATLAAAARAAGLAAVADALGVEAVVEAVADAAVEG